MRSPAAVVAALLALASLAGCGGDDPDPGSTPEPAAASTGTGPERLPLGKSVFPFAPGEEYGSPDGFAPVLRVGAAGDGWVSTHRGTDGFDVGKPRSDADAPLVVVAFVVPPEQSAADGLAAIRERAGAAGATVTDTTDLFGTLAAGGVQITGGDGELVTSRDAGIALDALPAGRVEVWPAGRGTDAMLIVVYVPELSDWDQAVLAVGELADGSRFE
jgi:hypothetical protein